MKYQVDNGETCLKPIGALAQLIERTSAADMLLFMVCMSKEQQKKDEAEAKSTVTIGIND